MSEQKWPKEPWERGSVFERAVFDADGENVIDDAQLEVVERIVSCVNALAGIRDPEAWVKLAKEAIEIATREYPGSKLAEDLKRL